jgi:hypothetical protein
MKRTFLFTTALAATVGVFALGASAQQQDTQAQGPQRLSIAQIATLLESQGYTVLEIELERGRYDVEMTDRNGMRVEAYLDPTSGAALPYRSDEDDDRRDRDDDERDEGADE